MSARESNGRGFFALKIGWPVRFLCVLVISAITAGIMVEVFFGSGVQRDALSQELRKARSLGMVCRLYASDHQGNFPKKLRDLEPQYIPGGQYEKMMFKLPGEKSAREWKYFDGCTDESDPAAIIIASPVASGKKRIIVCADDSGYIIPEQEFQIKINAQTIAPQSRLGANPR